MRSVTHNIHWRNLGVQGKGANAPQIFFLAKNTFFITELKRGKQKQYKYFLNDYFGGVKKENTVVKRTVCGTKNRGTL